MSANNQLVIQEQGKNWQVSDVDVDTGEGLLISDKKYKSLEAAIKAGNKYMEDNEVEYGLNVQL